MNEENQAGEQSQTGDRAKAGEQSQTGDRAKAGEQKTLGRRGFLKSLFGLTAVTESNEPPAAEAKARAHGVRFFWTNVRNGQVAFPTGMDVPSGQPGSLMKIVTAAALRENGYYCANETIECRGVVEINHHSYKCLYPHGKVDLVRALGLSCNVFFAQASLHLNPKAIIEFARMFGLETSVAGYAPAAFPQQPKTTSDEYGLGLAADLQPNALQLMRLVALVGMNGKLPALHNAAERPESEEPFSVTLQSATWHLLQQGLRIAEREGTARHLDPKDTLKIAAKTGTAPHGKSFQSWIAGYFPYDAPKYAFCLRAQSGTSQESAVPEAHSFLFAAPWP